MLENFCGLDGLCGWEMIGHIVDRSFIHIASGGSVLIATVCGLGECVRRGWLWKMAPLSLITISIAVGLLIIGVREPYDVYRGDPPSKSTIDGLAWLTGMSLAVVGIFRIEVGQWISGAVAQWQAIRKQVREQHIG